MKKNLVIIIMASVLVGVGIYFLLKDDPTTEPATTLSDASIKSALNCERMTADYRMTDALCGNLPYARSLFERGLMFGASIDGAPKAPAGTSFVIVKLGSPTQPVADTAVRLLTRDGTTDTEFISATTDGLGIIHTDASLPANTDPLTTVIVVIGGIGVASTSVQGTSGQYIVPISPDRN